MSRKQNGFIFAEIAIISILSFYFIDHFTVLTYNMYGCHFDGEFERDHLIVAEAVEMGTDTSATLNTLRDQIQALPEVQHVYAADGFVGEEGSTSNRIFAPEADTTHCVKAVQGWFSINEPYFETLGLTPIAGSPSAKELSSSGDAVITRSMAIALFGTDQVVGRRLVTMDYKSWDRSKGMEIGNRFKIGGVVEDFRLKPEDRHAYSIVHTMGYIVSSRMYIRLRPEVDTKAFIAKLQSASRPMRAGKYVLGKVISYNDYTSKSYQTNNNYMWGAIIGVLLLLLLLNVALGTLGTYWLQILKRTEDFGIMRSFGAKRINVFGMIWSEVALLTFFACLLGQVIWFQVALRIGLSDGMCDTGSGMEKDWVNNFWLHYGIICLIQYILLLTIVTLGMIIPSLIATYKKPVDALHYE